MFISLRTAALNNLIGKLEIRLNGKIMHNCIYADETGVVIVNRPDLLTPEIDYTPKQILHGDVQILMGDRK